MVGASLCPPAAPAPAPLPHLRTNACKISWLWGAIPSLLVFNKSLSNLAILFILRRSSVALSSGIDGFSPGSCESWKKKTWKGSFFKIPIWLWLRVRDLNMLPTNLSFSVLEISLYLFSRAKLTVHFKRREKVDRSVYSFKRKWRFTHLRSSSLKAEAAMFLCPRAYYAWNCAQEGCAV